MKLVHNSFGMDTCKIAGMPAADVAANATESIFMLYGLHLRLSDRNLENYATELLHFFRQYKTVFLKNTSLHHIDYIVLSILKDVINELDGIDLERDEIEFFNELSIMKYRYPAEMDVQQLTGFQRIYSIAQSA